MLVLTERCSRKEIIEKIAAKTQKEVIKGLDRIERRMGVKEFRKQLMFDFKSSREVHQEVLKAA